MDIKQLLSLALPAAVKGGEAIMEVYASDFAIEHKEDKSPLTLADKRAHEAIVAGLAASALPVLSEEGKNIPYADRVDWPYFWMVDPLDGTKEFIKRNGEFTVNIALIHRQQAVLGVIYVPATKVLYFGAAGIGAFKSGVDKGLPELNQLLNSDNRLPMAQSSRPFRVVGSRSHLSEETQQFVDGLKNSHPQLEFISSGSSLKLCLVAEGSADVYPRFAPTMEWDTAAGQAIVEAAGKEVLDYTTNGPLLYNKENLLNNWFIVK